MNCFHSKVSQKHDGDPEKARLIIMWSCDKCVAEGTGIEFYDHSMRQLTNSPLGSE
jgi:hypothetical protein